MLSDKLSIKPDKRLLCLPPVVWEACSMGGPHQVGERHIPLELSGPAARLPVPAAAAARGRGLRRLQLLQGGGVLQTGLTERH